MSGCVLTWASGHKVPKPVYLRQWANGWDATYDRAKATVFPTAKAATDCWLSKHAWPEDYEKYIANGEVRADPVDQPKLTMTSLAPVGGLS